MGKLGGDPACVFMVCACDRMRVCKKKKMTRQLEHVAFPLSAAVQTY